jgi:hypothetical protein
MRYDIQMARQQILRELERVIVAIAYGEGITFKNSFAEKLSEEVESDILNKIRLIINVSSELNSNKIKPL